MYSIEEVKIFILQKFPDANEIKSLAKGGHAHAYSYSHHGKDYVIRFSPHSEDFAKDKFIAQFNQVNIPIPIVYETGVAFDGYYAITEKATGIMLDDLNTDQILMTTPSLLAILDALRDLDISDTVGYGSVMPDGNGRCSTWQQHLIDSLDDNEHRRVFGWSEKLAKSKYGMGTFNTGFKLFQEMIKTLPSNRHLIHYDLLNQNVLVNKNVITAVFDWGCATYGDFVFELASFTFWAPLIDGYRDFDWKEIFREHFLNLGIEVENFDERLRTYELFIGLDHLAYNAHKDDWKNYEETEKLVLELI